MALQLKQTLVQHETRVGSNQIRFTTNHRGTFVQRAVGPFDGPMCKVYGNKMGDLDWYPMQTMNPLTYYYFPTLEEAVKMVEQTSPGF